MFENVVLVPNAVTSVCYRPVELLTLRHDDVAYRCLLPNAIHLNSFNESGPMPVLTIVYMAYVTCILHIQSRADDRYYILQ